MAEAFAQICEKLRLSEKDNKLVSEQLMESYRHIEKLKQMLSTEPKLLMRLNTSPEPAAPAGEGADADLDQTPTPKARAPGSPGKLVPSSLRFESCGPAG